MVLSERLRLLRVPSLLLLLFVAGMKTTVDHAPSDQRKHIAARQMEELMGLLRLEDDSEATSEDDESEDGDSQASQSATTLA